MITAFGSARAFRASGEPVLAGLLPVERLLFESPLVCIGSFRCATNHALFPGGLPSSSCCFVFPRTSVWIQHEGRRRFLADPTLVTFYNQGQVYRRFAADEDGDRADWFAIAPDVLAEAMTAHDTRTADAPKRPFRFEKGPSDPALYLAQRRLFRSLAHRTPRDPLEIEEAVFGLLDRVVSLAGLDQGRGPERPARPDPDCAEAARAFLALHFTQPLALSQVASAQGVSAPYLCRAFRRRTGTTLGAHRRQLRLRTSLERVAAGEDLSAVALDLGFNSHSHFTASFRRVFGLPPSAVRGAPRQRVGKVAAGARAIR